MVLVEWESPEAFQSFVDDPAHADLHPLRENGTENYLWWSTTSSRICARCSPAHEPLQGGRAPPRDVGDGALRRTP